MIKYINVDNGNKMLHSLLKNKGQSIRTKLIVTFNVIALAPLFLMSWFSLQHVSNSLEKSAQVELGKLSSIDVVKPYKKQLKS